MTYYLGIPAQVLYRSTTYASGYQDVHAVIERPDGAQIFVPMQEMSAPFQGIYQGIVSTSPDDPQGDYVVLVVAPEDGRKDVTRMSFYPQPASQKSVDQLTKEVENLTDIIEIFTL